MKSKIVETIGISILFFSANLCTTSNVGIPSTTPLELLIIASNYSPFPSLNPQVRFLDRFPKLVSIKSPIPASPKNVSLYAPFNFANFWISIVPRTTNAVMVLIPNPLPCMIPAPIANTFLSAPAISTPITS